LLALLVIQVNATRGASIEVKTRGHRRQEKTAQRGIPERRKINPGTNDFCTGLKENKNCGLMRLRWGRTYRKAVCGSVEGFAIEIDNEGPILKAKNFHRNRRGAGEGMGEHSVGYDATLN
jgi:hypothetical protein